MNSGTTKRSSRTSKAEVLQYLKQLYQNHSPEFIYYKTLFHIFERFLGRHWQDRRLIWARHQPL